MPTRARIVHATDFSTASNGALATAVELARTRHAELVICHVVTPITPPVVAGYLAPEVFTDLAASVRLDAGRRLGALVAKARRAGVRARGLLVDGVPFEHIPRVARSQRADLLVMGTHGHGGLGRLLLGSVAHRVIATSSVPVLTVRPMRPSRRGTRRR